MSQCKLSDLWISFRGKNQNNKVLTMDRPEVIGERLKRLRMAKGWPQAKAFCESIGVQDTAWNNWEKGRRIIPIDVALKVAAKTGASLDYIYRGMEHTLPKHVLDALEALDRDDGPFAVNRPQRA